MYSPAAIGAFEKVKALLDPDDVLNPGVLVRPARLDDDVRVAAAPRRRERLALAYPHDGGDFSAAVHRCTGVGKCRADLQSVRAASCARRGRPPARRRTPPAGRARVLQEMIAPGGPVDGWRAPEVHDALDLCLSCKGCSRDCPTGVDMATYKAEVLHQSYRRRLRPDLALHAGPAAVLVGPRGPGAEAGQPRARLDGSAAGWPRPAPASTSAARCRTSPRARSARSGPHGESFPAGGTPVALWVDSFTDHFAPHVATAAARVLEAAGYRVHVPGRRHLLRAHLDHHRPARPGPAASSAARSASLVAAADAGWPIVGVEPSCTAVLRGEALDLVGGAAAERVAAATRTLAELLTATPGWQPPRPDRRGDRRPAALPPRLGARLVGRRRGCWPTPAPG